MTPSGHSNGLIQSGRFPARTVKGLRESVATLFQTLSRSLRFNKANEVAPDRAKMRAILNHRQVLTDDAPINKVSAELGGGQFPKGDNRPVTASVPPEHICKRLTMERASGQFQPTAAAVKQPRSIRSAWQGGRFAKVCVRLPQDTRWPLPSVALFPFITPAMT